MKKKFFAILLLPGALLISSCDKAKIDVNFDLDITDIYFTIDTTSQTGAMTFATTQFNSTLQSELDSHDASLDDVTSVTITGVEFIHLNPQNFDIVDRASAYLSASGLPEQRIAYKDPIPDGQTIVTMNVDQVDLKQYLAPSTVTFRADGFLSAPNVQRDSIQVRLSFDIKAEVSPN